MKKINVIIGILVLSVFFSSCLMEMEEEGDKEKIVEMTVYPETGYTGYLMSDNTFGEFLVISDSDDKKKRLLAHNITEGFSDFDYEKGYEHILKVRKVWMKEPPQDVSSIRYDYLETLSKEKVIKENSEQEIEIDVASKKVQFIPRSATEIREALFIKEKGEDNWNPLIEIKGFDYEEGYTYTLNIKKVIQAEPYSIEYILLDIISKEKKDKEINATNT